MDHEATREWIDEAFFTPGARDAQEGPARLARAHLAACAECTAYDEATQRAALKLDLARGPTPHVRTRLMAAASRSGAARTLAPDPAGRRPWWRSPLGWRLAAAAVTLAVIGAVGGAWWAGAARPDADADHLPDAVAMMSTLAGEPGAAEVVLRDAAGNGAGVAVLSAASHRLAVFATTLNPNAGYHCYVERAGQRTWIGTMYVAPGVQFWAGAMEAGIEMQPGDVLVVALSPTQPAAVSAPL
ncbi:MAG: hypothetical protein ABI725_00660 [Chloroflexota bacterium]